MQRFMAGRYGGDQFGRFLSGASLVLLLLGLFFHDIFYWLGLAVLVYSYFRIFSRDHAGRRAENEWYLARSAGARHRMGLLRQRWALRRTYRYFRCPHCRQELRVPRGRGRISITCPKCGMQFIRRA